MAFLFWLYKSGGVYTPGIPKPIMRHCRFEYRKYIKIAMATLYRKCINYPNRANYRVHIKISYKSQF